MIFAFAAAVLLVLLGKRLRLSALGHQNDFRGSMQHISRPSWAYACPRNASLQSLVDVTRVPERKGIALDDTTWDHCPSSIPFAWPATASDLRGNVISSLRVFRQSKSEAAAFEVKRFLEMSRGRVLVGTQVTCDRALDDADWERTKEFLAHLGAEHVSAVAVGNELALLKNHPNQCADNDVWRYFLEIFQNRLGDLQVMSDGNFSKVLATTIFSAGILAFPDFQYLPNTATFQPEVTSVMRKMLEIIQDPNRFVLAMNFYPYFDPCSPLGGDGDPNKPVLTCDEWTHLSICLDSEDCVMRKTLLSARHAMINLLGEAGNHAKMWIGEMGWSSPNPITLNTGACQPAPDGHPREICPGWSSIETLTRFYQQFLQWDMSIASGFGGVDQAFWFTVRDALNFGQVEHFGLCGWGEAESLWGPSPCENSTSKI